MKINDTIIAIIGDKKGVEGNVLDIDLFRNRIQVKWPRGYMKTWIKIENVILKAN